MTSNQIYIFLRSWVNQILNTEGGESIPIIQSHQNAPSPEDPYITISYAGSRTKFGKGDKTIPDEDGNVRIKNDYPFIVEIWEENGNGDRLQALLNSTDREDIKDLFRENRISYLGQETIVVTPRLDGEEWIKEAMVEIRLAIASAIEEDSGLIETIEYEGTVDGGQEEIIIGG